MSRILIISSLAAMVMAATPALADGDAAAGEKVFIKCKACHENEQGVNKIGPTLKGIVGRKTASVEGYAYSDAMKAANVVWTAETLDTFLTNPQAMIPGNKMALGAVKDAEQRTQLIAYLKSASKPD